MILRSATVRAGLALSLLAGFYALGLSIGLGLLWLASRAWAGWVRGVASGGICNSLLECAGHTIAAASLAGGLLVLWSLRPRADPFEPPGPKITEAEQPELLAVLRRVAVAMGQPMPAAVFVADNVTAFVAERGGLMGVGAKTSLVLGLPMMQVLSEQELEAVLAHELAHCSSAQKGVSRMLRQTEAALQRTIAATDEKLIDLPFRLYAQGALYISMAIHRRHEFLADARAAQVADAGALCTALRKLTDAEIPFELYLATEVECVVRAGCLPPLMDGFRTYLRQIDIQDLTRGWEAIGRDLKPHATDSHPLIAARVSGLTRGGRSTLGGFARPNLAAP